MNANKYMKRLQKYKLKPQVSLYTHQNHYNQETDYTSVGNGGQKPETSYIASENMK